VAFNLPKTTFLFILGHCWKTLPYKHGETGKLVLTREARAVLETYTQKSVICWHVGGSLKDSTWKVVFMLHNSVHRVPFAQKTFFFKEWENCSTWQLKTVNNTWLNNWLTKNIEEGTFLNSFFIDNLTSNKWRYPKKLQVNILIHTDAKFSVTTSKLIPTPLKKRYTPNQIIYPSNTGWYLHSVQHIDVKYIMSISLKHHCNRIKNKTSISFDKKY
jgi:hypothetical protein